MTKNAVFLLLNGSQPEEELVIPRNYVFSIIFLAFLFEQMTSKLAPN